ncbi:UNVERIFIED_CONTAM: hypothetical protein Sangu_2075100 [Sesamum angustifolium]|uniref:DUF2921 domain-containing protein n=1 Tax=Sesamum angustifolium TaxID=2727405 RepID=A0AAW2LJ51_9LAMI
MPFDDRELSGSSIDQRSPLNLVSFWVTDVDRRHQSKNSIFVSGLLQMGITLEGLLSEKPFEGSPRFDIWPGHSQLSINFQGIYTESKKNHGERVMCLLGSTVLPSRQPDSGDPWGWVKEFGYTNQPLLTQDDQMILVLHYPRMLTLASRAIRGSMRNKEINATDGSFRNVKLVLQDVRCENMTSKENAGVVRVSSVFRAVPPSENQFTAAQRTGLSNMTLSAEGIWKSSSGQLCMVGCSGFVDGDGNGCDTRICLYVPLSFSIKQRSILLGTLSSIERTTRSYFPLAFEKLVRTAELWDQYTTSHPYYKYSKIEAASAVLEKDEPFNIGTVIKKSLLKFPKLEDMEKFPYSLSLLSEDLTLHIPAAPDSFPSSFPTKTDLELEILSLGPLFGRYWLTHNVSTFKKENPYQDVGEYTEKQLLVNVSAQLNLVGNQYTNFSSLSVEGIYSYFDVENFLIPECWKSNGVQLKCGFLSPTTARWLVNPTARISIVSQRNEDDVNQAANGWNVRISRRGVEAPDFDTIHCNCLHFEPAILH